MIKIIEITMITVPIKWNIVKISFNKKVANNAVTIGVSEKIMVAIDTSKYVSVLYQQYNPNPYTAPIAIVKKIFIGIKSNFRLLNG